MRWNFATFCLFFFKLCTYIVYAVHMYIHTYHFNCAMVSGNVLSDWQPVAGTDVASKKLTDNNTYEYIICIYTFVHTYVRCLLYRKSFCKPNSQLHSFWHMTDPFRMASVASLNFFHICLLFYNYSCLYDLSCSILNW